jgi:hypothetical protein
MTSIGLLSSRTRHSFATLAAFAAVVLIVVVSLGFTVGSVQTGISNGSKSVLANASAQSAAVQVTTHLADDSEAQETAAAKLLADLFPDGTITVYPARHSLATALVDIDGGPSSSTIVFGTQPALLDHAEIVDGRWPAIDIDNAVALQADAAEAAGLEVGDGFSVGGPTDRIRLTVAALWVADDPTDPLWFADSLVGSGHSEGAVGPALMEPNEFTELPTQLFATWTIIATPLALDPEFADRVTLALRRLPDSAETEPDLVDVSASFEGTLATTLQSVDAGARAAQAMAASAVSIVGLLGIIALIQLSTVLVASRRRHTLLVQSRGLSQAQLAVIAMAEGTLVAVPAAALGALAVSVLIGRFGTAVTIAAGTAIVAILCFAVVALLADNPGLRAAAKNWNTTVFMVGGGVTAVVAAIAIWQLYTAPASGPGLVASASSALALVAGVALGTTLLIPAATAWNRSAANAKSVSTILASRQIARRTVTYLVPVLALAVATASAVLAGGILTTWTATQAQAEVVGTGAALAVDLGEGGDDGVTAEPFSRIAGVESAAALVSTTATVGSDTFPFIAISPQSASRVLDDASDASMNAVQTTSSDRWGLAVGQEATMISVSAMPIGNGDIPTSTFDFTAWVADADGALLRIPLATEAGTVTRTGVLPHGVSPWRLVAIEATRTGTPDPAQSRFAVSRLSDDVSGELESGLSFDIDTLAPRPIARALLNPAPADKLAPLPIVVTDALAARIGVRVGDPITMTIDATNQTMEAKVTALAEFLPGTGSRLGIATDLYGLDLTTLFPGSTPVRANSVWISTANPASVTESVARTARNTALVRSELSTSLTPVITPALLAFWVAAAAAGILAVIALVAFAADDFRNREGDVAVLRALGVRRGVQVKVRLNEQGVVTVSSLAVGLVGGVVATILTVGPLIAAAIPSAARLVVIHPTFDWTPTLEYCLAIVSLVSLAAGRTALKIRRALVETGEERPS